LIKICEFKSKGENANMDENKGAPTFPILLAGKEYALRFDLDAQIGTTTTLKILGLGMQNVTWWRFLDAPYDVAEIMVLLQHGINGAKRFNQEKKFLTTEEAKKLYESHINYIYEKANDIEDDEEAMKYVQGANVTLFNAIQDAARGGSSFRKSRKKTAASE
jgi:hypothetical protein